MATCYCGANCGTVRVDAADELLDRSLVVTLRRGEAMRVWYVGGIAGCLDVLVREVL